MQHSSAKLIVLSCLCFCAFSSHAAGRVMAKSKPPTVEKKIEELKEQQAKLGLEQERLQRQIQEMAVRRAPPRVERPVDHYSYP